MSLIKSKGPLPSTSSLRTLENAAQICQRCDLYKNATQTVFGKGPRSASIMIVGEQPGSKEDLVGEPFVGPAGSLLKKCLESADINVSDVYLTNAVKHFKYVPQEEGGKARIHKKANKDEINACRPWLQRQIEIIKPKMIVALGVTASQSLFKKNVVITKNRATVLNLEEFDTPCIVSWHPSSILRSINREDANKKRQELIDDLKLAALNLKKSDRSKAA